MARRRQSSVETGCGIGFGLILGGFAALIFLPIACVSGLAILGVAAGSREPRVPPAPEVVEAPDAQSDAPEPRRVQPFREDLRPPVRRNLKPEPVSYEDEPRRLSGDPALRPLDLTPDDTPRRAPVVAEIPSAPPPRSNEAWRSDLTRAKLLLEINQRDAAHKLLERIAAECTLPELRDEARRMLGR